MHYLYFIVSEKTSYLYIGITNNLRRRFACHRYSANSGKKSPLYDCMRKHGVENFLIVLVNEFDTKEQAQQAEIKTISEARANQWKILNLADGGEGGYVVPEHYKDVWRAKLSKARQGRKPALGMKHTDANKKLFAECNKRKIPKYPDEVTTLPFKAAKAKYNISKTHYYRLLKRTENNALS